MVYFILELFLESNPYFLSFTSEHVHAWPERFSKTLVFSPWEMVPLAIATRLSYEAERLTVGKLIGKTPKTGYENRSYLAQ
jgi:hypothetical protein